MQHMPHYGWKTINIHGSTLDAAFRKTIIGLTKIEHLHRVRKSSSLKWKNPELSDIVDMNAEHVVNCEIVGDWDIYPMIDVLDCVKSVRIWSYSGSYFPAFGLNTERYRVYRVLSCAANCAK